MFYKHKEGGFNKRLYRVYQALANAGHDVHYLACERLPVAHPRIHFHHLRIPFSRNENILFWMFFAIIAPISALWVAWRVKPQKIGVFGSWYALFTCLPRLLFGCPLLVFLRADSVIVYQNENRHMVARAINYLLEYLGLKLATHIWVNIDFVRKNIVKRYSISPDRVSLIYNNISRINQRSEVERKAVRTALGIEPGRFMVATSGIFYKRKNIDLLIRAFSKSGIAREATLLIVGDDVSQSNERLSLEKLVADCGIGKSVIFTGWRTDSEDLIGASDLFVLPTMHEGFPNALLDAMGAACACLGSHIDEIKEVLYYDDLLFAIDTDDELAGKLSHAARDPDYLESIRRLTLERADTFCFDWDAAVVNLFDGWPLSGASKIQLHKP